MSSKPHINPEVQANFSQKVAVQIVTDGTSTRAELLVENHAGVMEPVGTGVARRRRGDRRDSQAGLTLAFARALGDAYGTYRTLLADQGYVV